MLMVINTAHWISRTSNTGVANLLNVNRTIMNMKIAVMIVILLSSFLNDFDIIEDRKSVV